MAQKLIKRRAPFASEQLDERFAEYMMHAQLMRTLNVRGDVCIMIEKRARLPS